MAEVHYFDTLTWPEVRALPRDIPIVLTLGMGYPIDRLSEALGNPSDIYLLPSFPFGWRGSGITVDQLIIEPYISNIIFSLRDDGFSNCVVLMPPGLNLNFSVPWIALQPNNKVDNSQFLYSDTDHEKVVVIPIGHTEQHGLHLPLSTDTLIINSIAEGINNLVPDIAKVIPVMPYGVSMHRQSFAGTLNVTGRAFEDFWVNIIDRLVDRGFTMFYFINGHGGNSSFLSNVVKYSGERHRRIFCATSWLYLSGPSGIAALEKYRQSEIGGMGHACELETSLVMHIKPELVHMDRVIDETDFVKTPSYYMDWIEGGALIANPPWDDDTRTGAYGSGSLGTNEKGNVWLKAAISEKISQIHEIQEQQHLREARRNSGYGLWGS